MRFRLVLMIVFFVGIFMSVGSVGFTCEPASTTNVCVNINTIEIFDTIQAAIDDADTLAGHCLVVVSDTCVHETVIVHKSVRIIGEPINQTPVVDGRAAGSVFSITADNVIIEGLVIENNCSAGGNLHPGIFVQSDNNIIRHNEFKNCFKGVYLYFNTCGNTVHDNVIHFLCGAYYGIMLAGSNDNVIYSNEITGTDYQGSGISLTMSSGNEIFANELDKHDFGIFLYNGSNDNLIHHNNFLDNSMNAYIENQGTPCTGNVWNKPYDSGGNYWSDHSGTDNYRGADQNIPGSDQMIDSPYTIPGGYGDTDYLPLVSPFVPVCGNVDGSPDHSIDLGDITYLNSYLGLNGALPIPPCVADVDGDGNIDLDDSQYLIDFIYNQGPPLVCPADCCQ